MIILLSLLIVNTTRALYATVRLRYKFSGNLVRANWLFLRVWLVPCLFLDSHLRNYSRKFRSEALIKAITLAAEKKITFIRMPDGKHALLSNGKVWSDTWTPYAGEYVEVDPESTWQVLQPLANWYWEEG